MTHSRPVPGGAHPGSSGVHPAHLRVGIVGAGRAGAVLGAALQRAGHRVIAASGGSPASRSRAAQLLPNVLFVEPDAAVADADLALLAIPDDSLPGLITRLADEGRFRPGQLVMHVSGRHGLAVLNPARQAGALPLAIHPVMTFAGTTEDLDRLANCRFGVTAPEPLWPVAEALVVDMGGEPVRIAEEQRGLYHAALSHGANHLVTLVSEVMDMLRYAGVDDPAAMLDPLLSAALENTLRRGDAALTGPVSRGDADTVAAHLATLSEAMPASVAAYLVLARRTADRVVAEGRLPAATAEPLLKMLAASTPGADR